MQSENCLIHLSETGRVFCRFWDEECVIYHCLTGQTHLLDGLGMEIFKVLSERTISRQHLLQHLKDVFDLPVNLAIEECLDNLIAQYQALLLLDVKENSTA